MGGVHSVDPALMSGTYTFSNGNTIPHDLTMWPELIRISGYAFPYFPDTDST